MNSFLVFSLFFFSLKMRFCSSQLSQTAELTGAGTAQEWNGRLLDAGTKVSVRHSSCLFGQTVADSAFRNSSSVTRYRAISRLHCVLICMQVPCVYFVFERNMTSPNPAGAGLVYPATNLCDVVNVPLAQTLSDDADTDVCTLDSDDVRCLVSPCYLMSGQAACSSESSAGPTCSCPNGLDPGFCYDGNFHTQK